ncbi:envelope-like protein, partial [Trifolium medium]|nr:envelope-like protein [Trifolium medium]
EFSPTMINQFLGRSIEAEAEMEVTDSEVCKTLTNNQIKQWPRKGKLSCVKLTVKYALLNKIDAVNWVPTSHSSDVATGIIVSGDVVCKRESPLTLNYRLLEGTHVSDIATTSVRKPAESLTRKQMIADLKDASKALVENEEGQSEDNAAGDNADGDDVQDEDTDGSPNILYVLLFPLHVIFSWISFNLLWAMPWIFYAPLCAYGL